MTIFVWSYKMNMNERNLVNRYYDEILENFYLNNKGVLCYKKDGKANSPCNKYKKGEPVHLWIDKQGYYRISIPYLRNKGGGTVSVLLHQVLWKMRGNDFPTGTMLDHINGNTLDNSVNNLRKATYSIQTRNRAMRSDNTSGITGICWNKSHKAWCIRRTVNGTRLSTYRKDLEEAKKVLNEYTKMDGNYSETHGKRKRATTIPKGSTSK